MQSATLRDQPRAIGSASVSSKFLEGRSRIDHLHQAGALKVVFPSKETGVEGILVNTAGGITGGDRFDVSATAGLGSELTLTTQAAERAYRAQPHQIGRLRTRLAVEDDAELRWLPQETILYDGSALMRRLEVDLASRARFLLVEPVIFGRRAMGEVLRGASFRDRIDIRQAGRLIYRDGVILEGDIDARLDRPAIGNGARAMANLVLVGPEAEGALRTARAVLGETGGASLLRPNLLAVRLLASDGFALRSRLVPLLDHLTHHSLPISWRL